MAMTDAGEWALTKRFDFNGQAVAYDSMGDADPVVLIHGTPLAAARSIGP